MNKRHEGGGNNIGITKAAKGFIATPATVADPAWYMDSKARGHVISNSAQLDNKVGYEGRQQLYVAD